MKDDAGLGARSRRAGRGNGAHLHTRNGAHVEAPARDHVPLRASAVDLAALATRFKRNPSEHARFLVELHRQGIPRDGANAPLDTVRESTQRARPAKRSRRKKGKVPENIGELTSRLIDLGHA